MKIFKLALILVVIQSSFSWSQSVRGFNLTENGKFKFVANGVNQPKSEAQIAIDHAMELGTNHIILNVRAKMIGPHSSDIIPVTGNTPVAKEARNIRSLVQYAHKKGLTVGIRPIFFVVGPNGEFPFIEKQADGSKKTWWHGNIQPKNPNLWFEQFQIYLDRYITISRFAKVDDFTIGAELYSMTVGIEDQWKEHPHGFPEKWLNLLRYVKKKLPKARIAYDINFTDDTNNSGGLTKAGGELERWRYRLVDLAEPNNPHERHVWQSLVEFWMGLDRIGIDMYRSFAFPSDQLPSDDMELVEFLTQRSLAYSTQLDTTLLDIEIVTGESKQIVLKEVGYRSVENAFINPFTYATAQGKLNTKHQAIAYHAFFKGFWEPQYPWFEGVAFWDIALDPNLHGPSDRGFSPIGKKETTAIIQDYFLGE